ncbi:hypothetical protein AAFF_G00419990 [Aldrovandia affinis]|uniref:Uncharacterized protein n=1 Tax=Aldrovandia affinis TaxID=143900 RepID=A0AAD7WJ35_9TELE|nr:hypothetical protein AAFF_G00419990 [Aldrovandia affinis]
MEARDASRALIKRSLLGPREDGPSVLPGGVNGSVSPSRVHRISVGIRSGRGRRLGLRQDPDTASRNDRSAGQAAEQQAYPPTPRYTPALKDAFAVRSPKVTQTLTHCILFWDVERTPHGERVRRLAKAVGGMRLGTFGNKEPLSDLPLTRTPLAPPPRVCCLTAPAVSAATTAL